jgi:hypothetical protein
VGLRVGLWKTFWREGLLEEQEDLSHGSRGEELISVALGETSAASPASGGQVSEEGGRHHTIARDDPGTLQVHGVGNIL